MASLVSLLTAAAIFTGGAFAGRGLGGLLRKMASDGGFASSRYYSLAQGFAASLPAIGHWFSPRGSRCPRLALLECLCGLASVACWELFPAGKAIGGAVFLITLIGAFFIDLDHMIIPDLFTIGLAVVGLVFSLLVPNLHGFGDLTLLHALRSAATGFVGLAIGSATVLWFGLIGEMLLSKEVLGFGDVKFLGAIGVFCGWQGALFALFGGAVLGAIALLVSRIGATVSGRRGAPRFDSIAAAGETGRVGASQPFPFGPMLASAAALYFLFFHSGVDAFFIPFPLLLQK